MKYFSLHVIWILALGYLLGYYFPGPGKMTVGRFFPSSGA